MTNIQLHEFDVRPPTGEALFEPITFSFEQKFYALTGSNGAGKSLLLAAMAQRIDCHQGLLTWHQAWHYLPQWAISQADSVQQALMAGNPRLAAHITALERLQSGTGTPEDIVTIDDDWGLLERLNDAMPSGQNIADNWRHLSGGERMQNVLAVLMSLPAFLLLDEPANHLDLVHRQQLIQALQRHSFGALVVTHDPLLLAQADVILHLDRSGLNYFSQGFDAYQRELHSQSQQQLEQSLQWKKRQQQLKKMRQQALEKSQQRASRGKQQVRDGSQGKALADFRARRASQALGQLNRRYSQRQQQLEQNKVLEPSKLGNRLYTQPSECRDSVWLSQVLLPNVQQLPITLSLEPGRRIWLRGNNGSGKSTLLECIAGVKQFSAGEWRLPKHTLLLDQYASLLPHNVSVIDFLQCALTQYETAELYTLLAGIGIDFQRAQLDVCHLSGGEKMKLTLLLTHEKDSVLLLDEPDNHLDLVSQNDLIDWLNQLGHAFIIVTHNEYLASKIERLEAFTLMTQ
ncbi:ABC transporter ATP-binding protein [Bacterioplanes sanyensis]|uniref:ATP-binding cassette domain-containing protein n=1 Tax=Bacterioplanes sanyensis TaxID=1249553 RepID=UPI0016727769|nr:ATP-binding cassette domain-containing protein [Bacterioplanes sanyensis]GGY46676.1 ABC transporter ATP-binding protein [Bacterioplanes sanyensis]